jgi:polygalacturonase
MMQSNVRLYLEAGAMIRGSRRNADYVSPPMPAGARPLRAFFVFKDVENAGITGQGAIDMEGYPWLWHDFQPDTGDGKSRSEEGLVNDPHGNGREGLHRGPLPQHHV